MDRHVFDLLTRSLVRAPTRRGALSGLIAGISSVLTGARFPGRVASKKNKKRNKPKKNAFGCLDVGKKCNGKNAKCCSGVCQGKRPNCEALGFGAGAACIVCQDCRPSDNVRTARFLPAA